MEEKKKNRWVVAGLVAITAASLFLHIWHIAYPDKPVFDEAHFATYASDYVKDKAFFDIHPPLGKLIYAGVLAFSGRPLGNTDFLSFGEDKNGGPLIIDNHLSYGNFPYVALRVVGSVFGALLPLAFFLFLRSIGFNRRSALLAALFVVFENAVLLDTRLILLNGMYIVFGLLALASYFHKRPILAGLLWGLCLGVKMIGVVFVGPVLIHLLLLSKEERKKEAHNLTRLIAVAATVFFIIVSINGVFFSVKDRVGAWRSIGLFGAQTSSTIVEPARGVVSSFVASVVDVVASAGGYLGNHSVSLVDIHPYESPWFLWPVMQVPMLYYYDAVSLQVLSLRGNYVVWFLSTLAVIFGFAVLPRYIKQWRSGDASVKPLFILLGGYVFNLLPYATIVQRTTFLYHYFPSLIFAIGILALGIGRLRNRYVWMAILVLATLIGFIYSAPFTYGLKSW